MSQRGTRQRRTWGRLAGFVVAMTALLLAGCGTGTGSAGHSSSLAPHHYNTAPGHVLIQLFQMPGFVFPALTAVPEWTLYGDGTLIFRADQPASAPPSGLLAAHLSSHDVNSILDVVTVKYSFYDISKTSYGAPTPDVGGTLLTVDADGQHKQALLQPKPGPSPDQQTKNVFSARDYLRAYHPASAAPYVAPSVALVVYGGVPSQSTTTWPFPDVGLPSAYLLDCGFLHGASCPKASAGEAGVVTVNGPEAQRMLSQIPNGSARYVQAGAEYMVRVVPLLPDALHPAAGVLPTLAVISSSQMQQLPLVSPARA